MKHKILPRLLYGNLWDRLEDQFRYQMNGDFDRLLWKKVYLDLKRQLGPIETQLNQQLKVRRG